MGTYSWPVGCRDVRFVRTFVNVDLRYSPDGCDPRQIAPTVRDDLQKISIGYLVEPVTILRITVNMASERRTEQHDEHNSKKLVIEYQITDKVEDGSDS